MTPFCSRPMPSPAEASPKALFEPPNGLKARLGFMNSRTSWTSFKPGLPQRTQRCTENSAHESDYSFSVFLCVLCGKDFVILLNYETPRLRYSAGNTF